MNGRWTVDEAKRLGTALAATKDESELVRKTWLAVYGRTPEAAELENGRKFLQTQVAELGSLSAAAGELVRALFNTNEFLYVD
jgi:hypothetical protein